MGLIKIIGYATVAGAIFLGGRYTFNPSQSYIVAEMFKNPKKYERLADAGFVLTSRRKTPEQMMTLLKNYDPKSQMDTESRTILTVRESLEGLATRLKKLYKNTIN